MTKTKLAVVTQPGIIKISKIKLTKEKSLEVSYENSNIDTGVVVRFQATSSAIVHKDFEDSLKALAPHLVLLCDLKEDRFVDKKKIESTNLVDLNSIVITGVSASGVGEEAGVVLIGQKIIGTKILNLVTPFLKWEDDYKFSSELGEAVERVMHEAREYMSGRKFTQKQEEIPFEESETEQLSN